MSWGQGFSVSNDQIFAVIDCLFRQKVLPYSGDAVYVFLAASNIQVAGEQTAYLCPAFSISKSIVFFPSESVRAHQLVLNNSQARQRMRLSKQ